MSSSKVWFGIARMTGANTRYSRADEQGLGTGQLNGIERNIVDRTVKDRVNEEWLAHNGV